MHTLDVLPTERASMRVGLRPIAESDAQPVFTIWSDPAVMEFYDVAPFDDLAQSRALIASMLAEERLGNGIRWAIVLKETGKLIGTCGFRIDHHARSATIGFELARSHWRRGLAREALAQCLDHAYGAWKLNRIQATTDLGNAASIGLLESLGFRQEGVMRQWGYWKGSFHDVRLFAIVRGDYLSAGQTRPAMP